MRDALNLVAAEMVRQQSKGYTPEHDDKHVNGELVGAALTFIALGTGEKQALDLWPWTDEPPNTERSGGEYLIRGAACLLAEIGRLQRMGYDFGDGRKPTDTDTQALLRETANLVGNILPGFGFTLLVTEFDGKEDGEVGYISNIRRDGGIELMRGYLAHLQEKGNRPDLKVQELLGGPAPHMMRDNLLKTELDQYEEVVRALLQGNAPGPLLATVTREAIEDHYAAEKTPEEAARAIQEQLKAN